MKSAKLKVLLTGAKAVDKTSLIKKIGKNWIQANYKLTVGVDILNKDVEFRSGEIATLSIWNIKDQQRFEFIRSTFYKGAAGAILVFDLTREETYTEVRNVLTEIRCFAGETIPFILVGDNVHLLKMRDKPIIRKEAREFANTEGGIYIEISPTNIDIIEGALQKLALNIIGEKLENSPDISETKAQLFLINPDGITSKLTTEGSIKDVLKTDECYVLVADDTRKIYLWKGVKSSVRSKFIGAKRSQEIRGQVGMHYNVIPLDEGDEDSEFLQLIGGKTKEGICASAIRKITSIMKKKAIDEIIFEKQYLLEVFSADLLEISKQDGFPNMKPFVISYFKSRGLAVDNVGNSIKLKKKPEYQKIKAMKEFENHLEMDVEEENKKNERNKDIFVTREYQFLGGKFKVREINRDLKNLRYCSNCDWISKEEATICEKCGSELYTMYSSDTKT